MNDLGNRLDALAGAATRGATIADPSASLRHESDGRAGKRTLMASLVVLALITGTLVWWQGTNSPSTSLVAASGQTTQDTQGAGGSDCVTEAVLEQLRSGLPTYDYDPAGSYSALAEKSAVVVSGRVASAQRVTTNGQGFIELSVDQVTDELGAPRPDIDVIAYQATWAVRSQPDPLLEPLVVDDLYFFGFLSPWSGVRGGWAPGPEGLYVACGRSGPLQPVIADAAAGLGRPSQPNVQEMLTLLAQQGLSQAEADALAQEQQAQAFNEEIARLEAQEQAELDRLRAAAAAAAVDAASAEARAVEQDIARIEALIAQAGAVSAEEPPIGSEGESPGAPAVDLSEIALPLDLPRFVLPPGWSIEWVTDKGIWTQEERASEIALIETNRPAGVEPGWPITTRAQAFRFGGLDDEVGDLVPAIVVATATFDGDRDIPQQPTNWTPIQVAGLVGSAYQGSAELYGPNVVVFMSSSRLDDAQLLEFVQALSPRNDDPAQGFDVTDERFELLFETTDDERPGESVRRPIAQWTAFWRHDNGQTTAAISTRQISSLDFQQRLLYSPPLGGHQNLVISGGLDDPFITGEPKNGGSFYWQYNTKTNLLIEVSIGGNVSAADAQGLFEALLPVELETWRAIVGPFNADPLRRPR